MNSSDRSIAIVDIAVRGGLLSEAMAPDSGG